MPNIGRFILCAGAAAAFASVLLGQGETTSAILGQVSDPTNAPIWRATVTVRSNETGLRRTASTDEAGRFNFPQLLPGSYTVEVSAQGFEREVNPSVVAGLGQKQTVDFVLRIASRKAKRDRHRTIAANQSGQSQHVHDPERPCLGESSLIREAI